MVGLCPVKAMSPRARAHAFCTQKINSVSQRRTMAGQAMVLGLVMLLVLCVGVIVLFDTGQTVNKKIELVNAADAAAYSVAVQEARALNYAAYANRARVANEVAIAQVIGLYSWMNQFHTTSIVLEKVMSVLAKIPYVGPIFQALSSVFKAIGQALKGIRRAYHGVAQAAVTALDMLNGALATSSRAILVGVARIDGILVARDIVKRNSADAALSAVGTGVLGAQLLSANNSFLQSYRIPRSRAGGGSAGSAQDRKGADRFRNVVMQSRDPFSWSRSDHDLNLFLIKFNQSGGTDMVDYDRWVAADAMGLEISLPWPLDDINIPLGWGGAQAVERYNQQRFMSGFGNGSGWVSEFNNNRRYRPYGDIRRENRAASSIIDSDPNVRLDNGQKKGAYFTGYQGLRDYADVKSGQGLRPYTEPGSRANPASNTGPIFTVHVETDVAKARTSAAIDGIGGPAGSPMALEDKAAGGKISAYASGQVYFNRPPNYALFKRGDNRLEVGNLFSPYWQARLTDTPNSVEALLGITRL